MRLEQDNLGCADGVQANQQARSGVALILVIIVLVITTAIAYRISSAVSQWKHRLQYIIDYQNARYACESGLKYALATIDKIEPNYVSRPNEPDFSDLFNMSDEEYKSMMQQWAQKLEIEIDANKLSKDDFVADFIDFRNLFDANDVNSEAVQDFSSLFLSDFNDTNSSDTLSRQPPTKLVVRGPYGPPWPYIAAPVQIEFGNAQLTIELIDENAKLPLSWGLIADANSKREAEAAIATFCEWMQMDSNSIEPLLSQLDSIKDIKPFSLDLKPIITATTRQAGSDDESSTSRASSRSARLARRARLRRARSITVQQTRPNIGHTMDFAKLLHSPLIDIDRLARPVNEDENRSESALKYISLWGTGQVNINTAPRHILEALFTFGGDAPKIADEIIKWRQIEPFKDIDDLKKKLMPYTTSIERAKPYITTQSDCFTIRVKATSGVAKVCATAGFKKEAGKLQKIGIIIE